MLYFPGLEPRVYQMRIKICTQVYITLVTLIKRNISQKKRFMGI